MLYSISAALKRSAPRYHRTKKSHYNISKIKHDDVEFPTPLADIPKLECQNNILINVYAYIEETDAISTLYKSEKTSFVKKVNLLTFGSNGIPHYAWIKNMKIFDKSKTNYEFMCRSCLRKFQSNSQYEQHLSSCIINEIDIPIDLKRRSGLVRMKCDDDDAFVWSVVAALDPIYNKHRRFCTNTDEYIEARQSLSIPDVSGLPVHDAVRFIGETCGININVFLYHNTGEITPFIIPQTPYDRFVDLLLFQDNNGNEVYFIINDLSTIYRKRTKMNKQYICRRCLEICPTSEKFHYHQDLCRKFKTQKVEMSRQPTLRFTNIRKQYPKDFICIAGIVIYYYTSLKSILMIYLYN